MKKEKHPELSQICSYGIFSKGLKNEFETAVVNEPSVFEPLKFYCFLKRAIKTIPRIKNKEKKERNSVCGKNAQGSAIVKVLPKLDWHCDSLRFHWSICMSSSMCMSSLCMHF